MEAEAVRFDWVDAQKSRRIVGDVGAVEGHLNLDEAHFDALFVKDMTSADRLARRWQSLSYPIFRRLALYAATRGIDG